MRRSTAPELYLKPLFVADASFGRDVVRDVQMDIHIGNRAAEPSLYTDLDVMLDAALMPQQVSAGWSIGDVLMGGQIGQSLSQVADRSRTHADICGTGAENHVDQSHRQAEHYLSVILHHQRAGIS